MELCVELRKGRTAKEELIQYKNLAQNTKVGSIEVVVGRFIEMAEGKVVEAKEKAREVAAKEVELAPSTPESILLSSVSSPSSASSIHSDCTSRALITPSLKFLWESYRPSLETLKNPAHLETIYQSVAQKAFCFCLINNRKPEFRRLRETLRLHLANVGKYTTQQRELQTAGAAATRANYYEKLSLAFLKSGDALYRATAWAKYYILVTYAGAKAVGTGESKEVLAGKVIVRALEVPVGSRGSPSHHHLSALLNLPSPTSGSATSSSSTSTSSTQNPAPSRSALLSSALS
ncbi:eukaryotic translation initiation factor 3 [Lentinula edodes]|nr:eukaryotic translation initiation factor 3 [Lentinula edodes]